ncbi:hypothetical protein BDQ17DRAFT_1327524 [Cyathus striatus]|nr:hypothetical protein BDQ17DRAFT_1327524 [Cyathus striatus]
MSMPTNSISVLRTGLAELNEQVKEKQDDTQARLGKNERPANKKKVINEIADAALKKHAVEQMSEVNGGDDIEGEVETIVPKLTRKAIAASMLLQHYMVDAEDPDARLLL